MVGNPDHLKYEEYLERQTEKNEERESRTLCVAVINFGRGESGGTSLTVVLGVVMFIVALSDSFRNEDDNLVFIFNNESQFSGRRNDSRRTELLEKWSSSLTNKINAGTTR